MQNEVSFAPQRQVKKGSFDRGLKLTKFILLPKKPHFLSREDGVVHETEKKEQG